MSWNALYAGLSPLPFDDALNDRQAQAMAFGAIRVNAREGCKQARLICR